MVGPTKLQPRFFSSFEIRTETAVVGLARRWARSTISGRSSGPGSNFQNQAASEPNSSTSLARALGVVDGRDDLAAMADDAGIAEQALDILVGEGGDLVEIEAGEGLAKILALAQDGQPGQAGLKTFEADLFEQPAVVGDRPAPFMVVVVQIVRQIAVPEAARDTVGAGEQAGVFIFHGQKSIR